MVNRQAKSSADNRPVTLPSSPVAPPEDDPGDAIKDATEEAWERRAAEIQSQMDRAFQTLSWDARVVMRASIGWRAVQSDEDWKRLWADARSDYHCGHFLLNCLGAERLLDPKLMATLWGLRHSLAEEIRPASAGEAMLIDLAVINYYHALRLNQWIGNFALHVEHDFFGQDGPSAKLKARYGCSVEGFRAEDHIARIGEQLLPLVDRTNGMVVKNLKAVQDLRKEGRPVAVIQISFLPSTGG